MSGRSAWLLFLGLLAAAAIGFAIARCSHPNLDRCDDERTPSCPEAST